MTKRSIFCGTFLCALLAINIFMLITSTQVFPDYGGFTRQIMFIKPSDQSAGYFIIFDELTQNARNYNIDWVLHTRGNITLSPNLQTFTTKVGSYVSSDNISLNVTFLEKIQAIEEKSGVFLPSHYSESYPYDDLENPYIIATYAGSANPIMATVIYPKNDTDLSQNFPEIVQFDSGLKKIGDSDYLFYAESIRNREFSEIGVNYTGELFFIRFNATNAIQYYYLQNAEKLQYETLNYFESDSNLDYILTSYANSTQISGCIKAAAGKSIFIKIYSPFQIQTLEIDGVSHPYSQSGSEVSFSIDASCSFVLSSHNETYSSEYDSLRDPSPTRVMPSVDEWAFNIGLIGNLTHPYILFSQEDVPNLKAKFSDTNKNWSAWYSAYISDVDSIANATAYDAENRYQYAYKLALKYLLDGGSNYLSKLIEFLRAMGTTPHWSQDLARAYAVQAFAITFDMVYNNLSISEINELRGLLINQSTPLMQMDLYPINNHRVVDAGGLGVAGLTLKDASMVDKATETILNYYYTNNPVDGGSFEGYSYNAFAVDEILSFATGLKRLGGYNLFLDPQLLATFDFMAETLGPLGMPSLYEDCTFSSRLQECLLIAAANINETYPEKAQHYQYIWEQRQRNLQYQSLGGSYYTYLNGDWTGFRRLMCYNVNETIQAVPFQTRKEIWGASGMAFMRSIDEPDGLFLSFNCKDYQQSHVHYDENSFELWAYGAFVINNPGYPGFGEKYHDWTISSEASNTILIDNSDQLQEAARGLSASISSPYFSMVVGDAREIYTDYAAFQNAPELVCLLSLNIALLGLALGLFIYSANYKKSGIEMGPEKTILAERIQRSKINLLKMMFLHPYQAQDYLVSEDPADKGKFLKKIIYLLIPSLMVIFYLIIILNIISIATYHMQYYEDKSQSLIDILNIAILFLLIAGPLLTISSSLFAITIYNRFIRFQIKMYGDFDQKKTTIISTTTLVWFLPVLVFSFFLLLFTTSNSFRDTIHNIFVGSGSIIFIYDKLSLLLREFIINLFIIIAISIPSIFICLRTYSYGTFQYTRIIPRKKATCISLISYIVLITMFFMLVSLLFFGVKLVISSVGIEGFIGGGG